MCSGRSFYTPIAGVLANSWRIGMDTYKWGYYTGTLRYSSYLSQYAGAGG